VFEDLPLPSSLHVEGLSFSGNDHPVSHGKAFGECRLIEFALHNSTLLADPATMIWKSTGRLVCRNLIALHESTPSNARWVGDLHNVPMVFSGRWHSEGAMDLRCFAFKRNAFLNLISATRQAEQAQFDASSLFRCVVDQLPSGDIFPRFFRQPYFEGTSGRTGRRYESPSQRAKDSVRALLRTALPSLWV
jgi:hypothetical protein